MNIGFLKPLVHSFSFQVYTGLYRFIQDQAGIVCVDRSFLRERGEGGGGGGAGGIWGGGHAKKHGFRGGGGGIPKKLGKKKGPREIFY